MGERDEQSVSWLSQYKYVHMRLECATIFYMGMFYITVDKKLAFFKGRAKNFRSQQCMLNGVYVLH